MYKRPTIAIIDLDHLTHNFKEACRLATDASLIIPVVKSDAYGHGCVQVSKELLRAGAQRLAVSLTEEALELREAGVTAPILILGGSYPAQAKEILIQGLIPVVSTVPMLDALAEVSDSTKLPVKIHIKIETGLGRMGIPVEEMASFLNHIKNKGHVSVEGVCTSFSSVDDTEFSENQFHLFERAVMEAQKICGKTLFSHLAHTGGLIRRLTHPSWFIRTGIMLYGYTRGIPAPGIDLKPVLTWKTEIFKTQTYANGHPIGYSGLYRTKLGSRIALLPVGYSDGLRRSYMGRGEVLIQGRRVPLVGRFSMDWCAAEVGHLPEVKEGDEVVLIGRQGNEFISAEEMAERSDTIVDEIFVSIAKRVARIYQRK